MLPFLINGLCLHQQNTSLIQFVCLFNGKSYNCQHIFPKIKTDSMSAVFLVEVVALGADRLPLRFRPVFATSSNNIDSQPRCIRSNCANIQLNGADHPALCFTRIPLGRSFNMLSDSRREKNMDSLSDLLIII